MLALKNARLIDGTGAPAQSGVTLLIQDGRIGGIGANIDIPSSAAVIDLGGKTVIPGLIDAHTHITGSSSFDRKGMSHRFESYDFAEMRESCLAWGVTTVRTMGDFAGDVFSFRKDVESGAVRRSPRVVAAGPFFTARGGHPAYTVYGSNPEIIEKAAVIVDDETDIEAEVGRAAAMGADCIKAFFAHLNKLNIEKPVPRLTEEQLGRIIRAAHKNGKPAAVHVDGAYEMRAASRLGADSIEHLIGTGSDDCIYTPDDIEAAKRSGAVIVPTMISIKNWENTPGMRPVWDSLTSTVRALYEAGVPMAVGCDSGIPMVPFGESVHDEMACLADVGIPALKVISMATGENARLLRVFDETGTLEPGKSADLIVLGSDPLENIRATKDIRLVMSRGRVVRDELLA